MQLCTKNNHNLIIQSSKNRLKNIVNILFYDFHIELTMNLGFFLKRYNTIF